MSEQIHVDVTTKIFFLIFIVVFSYFALSIIVQHFFLPESLTAEEYMARTMGLSHDNLIANFVPLIIALGLGLIATVKIKTKPDTAPRIRTASDHRQQALKIVKKKLSDDEKKMLKEIETAGTITQDSLRARLGWSKAKVSTTLTRMDKMNLIQRERQGKTYKVFLSKDLR